MVKVIVGCPVKGREWVLPRWFESVRAQEAVDTLIETMLLVSPDDDETRAIAIREADYVIFDDAPGRTQHEIEGHYWGPQSYGYM